jgi:hypothetical protein
MPSRCVPMLLCLQRFKGGVHMTYYDARSAVGGKRGPLQIVRCEEGRREPLHIDAHEWPPSMPVLTLLHVPSQAHHSVMVNAMKAKQTVDVAQCDALEHAVGDFAKMYLPKE